MKSSDLRYLNLRTKTEIHNKIVTIGNGAEARDDLKNRMENNIIQIVPELKLAKYIEQERRLM